MTATREHLAGLQYALDRHLIGDLATRRQVEQLIAEAQSAPEPVQGEAVEVVGYMSSTGMDNGLIRRTQYNTYTIPVMTVAQHNRIMAAASAKQASDDRDWLKAKQHRAALKEENAALRAQLSASAAAKPDAELVALKALLPALDDALEDLELHGRHSDQGYRKMKDWYRKAALITDRIDAKLAELKSCSPAE